jgi:uncharacterized pyridoxamine 5'-phosphate oxidase family protein
MHVTQGIGRPHVRIKHMFQAAGKKIHVVNTGRKASGRVMIRSQNVKPFIDLKI